MPTGRDDAPPAAATKGRADLAGDPARVSGHLPPAESQGEYTLKLTEVVPIHVDARGQAPVVGPTVQLYKDAVRLIEGVSPVRAESRLPDRGRQPVGPLNVAQVAHFKRALRTLRNISKDVPQQLPVPVALARFEQPQDLLAVHEPSTKDLGQERGQLVCAELRADIDHGLRTPGAAGVPEPHPIRPDEAESLVTPGKRLPSAGEDRDLGRWLLDEAMKVGSRSLSQDRGPAADQESRPGQLEPRLRSIGIHARTHRSPDGVPKEAMHDAVTEPEGEDLCSRDGARLEFEELPQGCGWVLPWDHFRDYRQPCAFRLT